MTCAALLWFALALLGGASRADEWQQLVVRIASILAITAALWPLEMGAVRNHRGMVAGLMLCALLPLLQLVPMPPAMWASLPGHKVYAQIAAETGHTVWRPVSMAPDLTVNALLALLPAAASLLAGIFLDAGARRRLGGLIVLLAGASAILGLVQLSAGGTAMHLYHQSSVDAPVGLFANRNHQAALLACALPLVGALAGARLRESTTAPMLVLCGMIATAALLGCAALATGSRAGLVLAAAGLLGCFLSFRATGFRLTLVRRQRAILALGAAAMLGLTGLGLARSDTVHRLAATETVDETRFQILSPLVETARAFMPLGSGFGSFDRVYRQFEPDALLSTIYLNEAHDEPLQLVIEGGVPALLLLSALLVAWARTAWCTACRGRPGRSRAMGVACLWITLILMASSLVDYPLRTPLLSALFVFAGLEMARAATSARAWNGERAD